MTTEIERFIRIESLKPSPGGPGRWHTVPNCTRLRVWHMAVADALGDEAPEDASPKRFIFHIGYVDGIARGFRVNYLGESFTILGVSDSTRLRGLELRCAPVAA
ncbi:MAG TPA: hypothetical protein VHZ56_08615 [Devosia sp.]|jgi:hypothetical protein|nr:hypothetical protein [Devosia sp.]